MNGICKHASKTNSFMVCRHPSLAIARIEFETAVVKASNEMFEATAVDFMVRHASHPSEVFKCTKWHDRYCSIKEV